MRSLQVGIVLTLLLAVPCVRADAPRDPDQHFFSAFGGDYSAELRRARDEGKRGILLFFEADDCPFCQRMKRNVLNQPEVQDYYRQHFLGFRVDIESERLIVDPTGARVSQRAFAIDRFRARATPVIAFLDLDGTLITRYTGAASGVREFLWLGEYVVEGHYQRSDFTRYKRERRKQGR